MNSVDRIVAHHVHRYRNDVLHGGGMSGVEKISHRKMFFAAVGLGQPIVGAWRIESVQIKDVLRIERRLRTAAPNRRDVQPGVNAQSRGVRLLEQVTERVEK